MEKWGALLVVYLLIINLTAFCLMGMDKRRAQRGQWRISERALFIPAILGGTPGALLGMGKFHHKTRHWHFRYGMPGLLIIQAAGGLAILWSVLKTP